MATAPQKLRVFLPQIVAFLAGDALAITGAYLAHADLVFFSAASWSLGLASLLVSLVTTMAKSESFHDWDKEYARLGVRCRKCAEAQREIASLKQALLTDSNSTS